MMQVHARPTGSTERAPRPTGVAAALVATGIVLCLAWGTARADGPAGERTADARGIQLYLENGCGTCHAFSAAGTSGGFGPAHDAMAVVAAARIQDAAYRGEATDVPGYVRESIVAPSAYVVPGYGASYHRMPPYSFLADEDLEALVALLTGPLALGGH